MRAYTLANFRHAKIGTSATGRRFGADVLIDALLAFHRSRQSGIVRAHYAATKKQLVIEGGLIAFAESNAPEEHLARVLLNSKELTRGDLPQIAACMKSGKPVDEAIVACCNVAPEKIQSAASEQAGLILASLLQLNDCEIKVYKGESLLRRKFHLNCPIPEALLQAARRAGTQPERRPLSPALLLRRNATAGRDFPLDSTEAFALSLLDRETSVQQLFQILPSASAESLLTRLLLLELASIVTPAGQTPLTGAQPQSSHEDIRELLERFEVSNYYEILSISSDASEQAIRDAYHELARRYHPDRFQSRRHGAEFKRDVDRLFTFITAAHRTLSDAAARSEYDQARLTRESQVEAALQARTGANLENEQMAETLFRAGRRALAEKDYDKAITRLKECVWLCPEVARYRRHLAAAQSEIPRFRKEAEQHLLKAIRLDEMNAESYLLLGKLYLNIDLPRKAEQQLQLALQWDPGNRQAERLLAQISKAE